MTLTPLNCGSENIFVEAVVVSELKFRDVQRHIFAAYLVEGADDTALEDRPETLNRLSVNRTDNVVPLGVVNGRMWEGLIEVLVADPLIRAEQANLVRNSFVDSDIKAQADVLAQQARLHRCLASPSTCQ